MTGALLLIPFFLIRFSLLSLLDKAAVRRAAYFAPLTSREKPAYYLYQISNVAVFVALVFLKIQTTTPALFYTGTIVFLIGSLTLTVSVVNFAAPSQNGMNRSGLYRFSRNPMYVAYFLYFIGCALLTQSRLLLGFVLLFQISAHWIILAEERWCIQNFGKEYLSYMEHVRRYL